MIINRNDLRVGNLVIDCYSVKHEVLEIRTDFKVKLFNLENGVIGFKKLEDVNAIFLNEEVLEMFGFIRTNEGFWSEALFIRVCENGGLFFDWDGTTQSMGTELRYLHELQNLYFSLRREEIKRMQNN